MQDEDMPWLLARRAVERLARGIPIAALGVRSSRSADIARIARASGHHALWVDLEHSTMPIDTAAAICAAAMDVGLAPFARVPEREYGGLAGFWTAGSAGASSRRGLKRSMRLGISSPLAASHLSATVRRWRPWRMSIFESCPPRNSIWP